MKHGVVGLASVACFIGAVAVLSNQTPYCYTRQEFRDGRVEYREFRNEADAFAYSSSQGFWSDRPDVVREESGCGSDKVFLWEGILGGTLALAGLAIPIASASREGPAAMVAAAAKTVLGLTTALALVSLLSFGSFLAPWLIPFHWLAARRASRWMRGVWITAAATCAYLLGALLTWTFLHPEHAWSEVIPFALAAVVTVAFVATTTPRREPGTNDDQPDEWMSVLGDRRP